MSSTNAIDYWEGEIDAQLRVIENLGEQVIRHRHQLKEAEKLQAEARTVLEGLERMASMVKEHGGRAA